MKKTFYIFLYLCFSLYRLDGYTQTTHQFPDGKIIFEDENSNLTNVTTTDSLRILKDVILVKYDSILTLDAINSVEKKYSLNRRYTCLTGWILYDVPDSSTIITLADSMMLTKEV